MKQILFVGIVLLAAFALSQSTPTTATPWTGLEEVKTVSQCAIHGSDSVLCIGTDGEEYSYQGAAFVSVGGGGAVTSVFGRTGAITAQSGDYSYSQIANPPTIPPAGVQTVNGKTPDSKGNVSLAATTTSSTTLQ